MEMLFDTLGFAAKGFIVFVTLASTVAVIVALTRRRRRRSGGLVVEQLNDNYEALGDALRSAVLDPKAFKKAFKARQKAKAGAPKERPRVYVLDFEGDLFANQTGSLSAEVTALVALARPEDEVVVRLESPGGTVPHYGFAAAQLVRLKDRKLKVTVCVDRVAASGGYMMACVAQHIVAAPFAIIGSIGVVAQVPNLHRLLKKHDVDFEEMTAGEFKRTVSVFGEISDKGRQKFQDQLEETHQLFKQFVKAQRPSLDVDRVATGEYWLASRALELGLVDRLSTSDDYLLERLAAADVFHVSYHQPLHWRERLGLAVSDAVERTVVRLLGRAKRLELG